MHTKKNPRRFRQLKKADRDEIEILLGRGYRPIEIAQALRVHRSTLSRELARRRRDGRYDAKTADRKACAARLHSKYQGMKVEAHPHLRDEIIRMLEQHRSPDEIAGRVRRVRGKTVIGTDAIYHWLYSAWGNQYARHLCTRRRRPKPRQGLAKRETIPMRIPLIMRPTEGIHGEADTFISPRRTLTTASVAVVVEQSSKLLWGRGIPNRKPATMARAMQEARRELALDDLTLDNGIENKNHRDFGLPAFFCDPHRPSQKPWVENGIGLIRRWFIPKGTDLRAVSEEALQGYLATLNGKYRKSLGYRSAYEVAQERGILKTKIPDVVRGYEQTFVAFEVRI